MVRPDTKTKRFYETLERRFFELGGRVPATSKIWHLNRKYLESPHNLDLELAGSAVISLPIQGFKTYQDSFKLVFHGRDLIDGTAYPGGAELSEFILDLLSRNGNFRDFGLVSGSPFEGDQAGSPQHARYPRDLQVNPLRYAGKSVAEAMLRIYRSLQAK